MDKTNLSNTTIMGSALVLLGVVLVIYDLSGIYKFLMTRKWITITGTVSSAETVGVLHRLITFTYSVHSGRKKGSQTLPRNSWTDGLRSGSPIAIRFNGDNPDSAVIDCFQVSQYVLFACLNAWWILVGIFILQAGH